MRQLKNQSESQDILTLLWFPVFYRHLWGNQFEFEFEEMCPCIFFTIEYFSHHQRIFLGKNLWQFLLQIKSDFFRATDLLLQKSCYCIWLHRLPNKFANICFVLSNDKFANIYQMTTILLFCLVKWEMPQRVFVIQAF